MENIITFTYFESFIDACYKLTVLGAVFTARQSGDHYSITITGY